MSRTKGKKLIFKIVAMQDKVVRLPNAVAQNDEMSYEALGLLTRLASRPSDWRIFKKQLQNKTCGRDRLNKLFSELTAFGHLAIYQLHDNVSGQFLGNEYSIFVDPSDNPAYGEAVDGITVDGETPPTKKDKDTKKEDDTKKDSPPILNQRGMGKQTPSLTDATPDYEDEAKRFLAACTKQYMRTTTIAKRIKGSPVNIEHAIHTLDDSDFIDIRWAITLDDKPDTIRLTDEGLTEKNRSKPFKDNIVITKANETAPLVFLTAELSYGYKRYELDPQNIAVSVNAYDIARVSASAARFRASDVTSLELKSMYAWSRSERPPEMVYRSVGAIARFVDDWRKTSAYADYLRKVRKDTANKAETAKKDIGDKPSPSRVISQEDIAKLRQGMKEIGVPQNKS